MAILPFATGTHIADSLAIDTEYLANLFPKMSDTGKSVISLIARPGLEETANFGQYPLRAIHITGDSISRFRLFAVHYDSLFGQDENQEFPTFLGKLDTTEGVCYMASNGDEVLITDGANGYVAADDITCGEIANAQKACEQIIEAFSPLRHALFAIDRGMELGVPASQAITRSTPT